MRKAFSYLAIGTIALMVGACSKSGNQTIAAHDASAIRPMTEAEAVADFDTMVASIRSLYGPLEYKQRRFGYDFETEAQTVRAKFSGATTDAEKQALFYELLRKLQDGHVSLTQPIRERYEIPIIVMPIEDKFIVSAISPTLAPYGIGIGDEVVAVDGMTPEDALKIITKYTWFANPQSDRHMIYNFFLRPSIIPELKPQGSFAQIEFVKPDGTKKLTRIAWRRTSPQDRVELVPKTNGQPANVLNGGAATGNAPVARRISKLETKLVGENAMLSDVLNERLQTMASIKDLGIVQPWFWNPKLKRKYGVTMVAPERERVDMFYKLWAKELDAFEPQSEDPGALPANLPQVWAAMYRYAGKTVLMVRQPSYSVDNIPLYLAIYSALIDQYQPIADVLVIDQTHNPGGAVTYAEGFTQLFAPNGANSFVQFLNADRLWFARLSSYWTTISPMLATTSFGARLLSAIKNLEFDSEAGLRLTRDPFSFSGREISPPAPGGAVWKKPILMLIDELCASGGDAVPMLLKANHLVKLFGNRTSGMGGSVEKVVDLPASRATLNLTRGLFTTFRPDGQYTDADFVENNGVTPDVVYTHTVKDVRDGFDAYFKTFSDEATK